MPTSHTVKPGEHLSGIAEERGFADPAPIWTHPDNAELRETRAHEHVLAAGDLVVIPDPEPRAEAASTEQRHTFRYKAEPLVLRLRLLDVAGTPMADTPCELVAALERHELQTDGDGKVEQQIKPSLKTATLKVDTLTMPLAIGALDPISTGSGQQARLENLGYFAGDPFADPGTEPMFVSAVEEFQCDHDLTVDGICGPNTQTKLAEVYGY